MNELLAIPGIDRDLLVLVLVLAPMWPWRRESTGTKPERLGALSLELCWDVLGESEGQRATRACDLSREKLMAPASVAARAQPQVPTKSGFDLAASICAFDSSTQVDGAT